MCVYIYICLYVNVYIYIYIYTHTYVKLPLFHLSACVGDLPSIQPTEHLVHT